MMLLSENAMHLYGIRLCVIEAKCKLNKRIQALL